MKMKIFIMLAAVFLCTAGANAAPDGQKGASEKAHEHANEQSIFKRVGNWFDGLGKSDEEKEAIKAEKKAKKMKAEMERLAEKKADQKEKKAKKEAKERQKAMEEEAEQMREKVKREKMKQKKQDAIEAKSDMRKGSGTMKGSMKTK